MRDTLAEQHRGGEVTKDVRKAGPRDSAGFTLVEMLLVVALMGMLASVALPNLTGHTYRAREASYQTDLLTVQLAVDAYLLDQRNGDDGSYPTLDGLVPPDQVLGDPGCHPDGLRSATGPCVDFRKLATIGGRPFLRNAPLSAGAGNNVALTGELFQAGAGSYTWYLDRSGKVHSAPAFTIASYP